MFVGLGLLGAGVALLWGAVTNENPISATADVLRGEDTDRPLISGGPPPGNDPGRAPAPRDPGPTGSGGGGRSVK